MSEQGLTTAECGIPAHAHTIDRLIADVERLTAERDAYLSMRDEARLERDEAEAQREQAVTLLGKIMNVTGRFFIRQRGVTEASTWKQLSAVREDIASLLASLSTVTGQDWAKHQLERARNAGKTEAELRVKYGLDATEPKPPEQAHDEYWAEHDASVAKLNAVLDQPCKRANRSCCHADWCLTHDAPWPCKHERERVSNE